MNRSLVRAIRHAPLGVLIALGAACDGSASPTDAEVVEGIIFLVESQVPGGYRDALYQGRVVLDAQGCVRLESSEPATVVWPHGSRLVTRGGELYVVDKGGSELAKIGGESRFGGGYTAPSHAYLSRRDRNILASRCPGDIWIATPNES